MPLTCGGAIGADQSGVLHTPALRQMRGGRGEQRWQAAQAPERWWAATRTCCTLIAIGLPCKRFHAAQASARPPPSSNVPRPQGWRPSLASQDLHRMCMHLRACRASLPGASAPFQHCPLSPRAPSSPAPARAPSAACGDMSEAGDGAAERPDSSSPSSTAAPPPPVPAAPAALREDQITNAVAFLSHPKVRCRCPSLPPPLPPPACPLSTAERLPPLPLRLTLPTRRCGPARQRPSATSCAARA